MSNLQNNYDPNENSGNIQNGSNYRNNNNCSDANKLNNN